MGLKTGAELRHANKLRVEAFKKKMKEHGYRNVTIFMSIELREEIERLKKKEGLNRQNALEHIFEAYKQSITTNITSNKKIKSKEPEFEKEEVQPPENIRDYRVWLVTIIQEYKDKENLTNAQIAVKLNEKDLQTTAGNQWNKNAVKSFWNRREKI